MNIQIIGTKKCRDTQKAVRYFKERKIPFHFVDLNERILSKGEFDNITSKIKVEDLIDVNSKVYKDRNYGYLQYDPCEELFEHQLMLKTPVIRNGNEVSSGVKTEIWKDWA